METKNQTAQESAQSGVVDYAAALRQYHRYDRGRSMKKYCEDEGYDYWKFCKLAREGQSEMDAKIIAGKHPVFIEVNPDGRTQKLKGLVAASLRLKTLYDNPYLGTVVKCLKSFRLS